MAILIAYSSKLKILCQEIITGVFLSYEYCLGKVLYFAHPKEESLHLSKTQIWQENVLWYAYLVSYM